MAQAHVRLGSKVTVIEGANGAGVKTTQRLAAIVLDTDARRRCRNRRRLRMAAIDQWNDRWQESTVKTPAGNFTGSHLLMAVGRKVEH